MCSSAPCARLACGRSRHAAYLANTGRICQQSGWRRQVATCRVLVQLNSGDGVLAARPATAHAPAGDAPAGRDRHDPGGDSDVTDDHALGDETTVLAGGGEMGVLMRGVDWSKTSMGPVEHWPQTLRSVVGMLLPSRAQIILFWGLDFTVLSNDSYRR